MRTPHAINTSDETGRQAQLEKFPHRFVRSTAFARDGTTALDHCANGSLARVRLSA
jgi:hypothetical protein